MNQIIVTYKITNTTTNYLLVGNASKVISAFFTLEEALNALNAISIEDSEFAGIHILRPGQEWVAEFLTYVPNTKEEDEEEEKNFQQLKADGLFPWMIVE